MTHRAIAKEENAVKSFAKETSWIVDGSWALSFPQTPLAKEPDSMPFLRQAAKKATTGSLHARSGKSA